MVQAAFVAARMASTLYALDLGVSSFAVGAIVALFSAVPALLALRMGRWLDRVGWRPPALCGLGLLAGAAAGPAFIAAADDFAYVLIAASAIATGTGLLCIQATTQHLVGSLHSADKRVAGFARLALGYSVAAFVGSTVCGWAIEWLGYAGTYRVILAMVLSAALPLLRVGYGLPAPAQDAKPDGPRAAGSLLSLPGTRTVLLLSAVISMAWDVEAALIPIFGREIGLPASRIGLAIGCLSVGTFLVRMALPAIRLRVGEWSMLLACIAISAAACLLIPLSRSIASLSAATFVLGLGLGAAQPNILALLHAVAPPTRLGEAHGMRLMLMNGSHALLPVALGAASGMAGAGLPFLCMAALLGCSAVVAHYAGPPVILRPAESC